MRKVYSLLIVRRYAPLYGTVIPTRTPDNGLAVATL